jgi:transposase
LPIATLGVSQKTEEALSEQPERWRVELVEAPLAKPGRGKAARSEPTAVVNAILYILKTGCQWRQLPHEFPAWSAVYYYFRRWSGDGTWERLHGLLRSRLRERAGVASVKVVEIPGRNSGSVDSF